MFAPTGGEGLGARLRFEEILCGIRATNRFPAELLGVRCAISSYRITRRGVKIGWGEAFA